VDLGRYRLIAELARGGMGIVHLAEARGPGGFEKLVVVKELKPELSDDPVYTAMFLDEACLAARLSHRHIVQTNEVGCAGGRYFMALELLEGGSLHQLRGKLGVRALPLHLGVRVLVAVLDALDHAHELADDDGASLGVVHRDVSPQNVFLTWGGDVKLIDFGVAKSNGRRGAAAVTRVGVVKGSVPYMSPDHVDGSTIDRRADVFAAGVLLREMLLGERLWADIDDLGILRCLIARDLPAFPERAGVPAQLRAIAMHAMAPRREDRIATAAAMRDELKAYLAEVDPGGSLEDLGSWLARTLADERAAFRVLVKKSRASVSSTTPGTRAAKAHVWLPSTELHTRFSGPPALPARPKAPSFARWLGPAAVVAVSLGIAAFGFGRHHTEPSTVERTPRVVESGITANVDTSAAREAPPTATESAVEAVVNAEPPMASQVPAAVLREALPPNPYDPNE
jgi:eukaryotic-like serine/threonine-protein kinase